MLSAACEVRIMKEKTILYRRGVCASAPKGALATALLRVDTADVNHVRSSLFILLAGSSSDPQDRFVLAEDSIAFNLITALFPQETATS